MRRALFLLLLCATGVTRADEAAFLRCRELADAARRLACYDAVEVQGPARNAAPTTAASATDQFGLARREPQQELGAIESHIEGRFSGWQANDRIALANGQIWQIVDGSSGALDAWDPKIRIRRGMLGAFYLEFEASNRSPRVKRVR